MKYAKFLKAVEERRKIIIGVCDRISNRWDVVGSREILSLTTKIVRVLKSAKGV